MHAKMNLKELQELAKKFRDERDWKQFHNPRSLASNIMVEAAELGEIFTWTPDPAGELEKRKQDVADELSDILFGVFCFANITDIDLEKAYFEKCEERAAKYPVEKCKGRSDKYTAYQESKPKKD